MCPQWKDWTTSPNHFLSNKGIKHICVRLYHPQANGGVEMFNQSLKNGIRACLVQGYSFQMALNQTLLHYRASQEMELHLDRLRAQGLSATVVTGPQAAVKVAVTTSQGRMKDNFGKRYKVRSTSIKVLDWVRVRRPHRSSKMASSWSEPHQVVRQLGSSTFLLIDGSRRHASRLQKVPIPLTPTRGQWATEPNAGATQGGQFPVP